MSNVPAWLLRHTCTVEPYQGWALYGAPYELQCFIAENLAAAGPTGTERIAQITIVARKDADVPAGSRITLGDGRRGYAAAVAVHDGGGFPTPDHMEIAMQTAGSYGPAFGEPVVVLYRQTAYDAAGNAVTTWRRVTIDGAAVHLTGGGDAAIGTAEATADTVEVILPPGTPIGTRDRLEVRGLLYDVDGTPTEVTDPQTVARPGVRVIGRRRAS
jgi:head-tail adaptor